MTKQKNTKSYQNEGSLGFQVFLSLLKNFANNRASSLISVSSVCFCRIWFLEFQPHFQKRPFKPSAIQKQQGSIPRRFSSDYI